MMAQAAFVRRQPRAIRPSNAVPRVSGCPVSLRSLNEARNETRTRDPFLTMEVLYQLSYPGESASLRSRALRRILDGARGSAPPPWHRHRQLPHALDLAQHHGRSQRLAEGLSLRAGRGEDPALGPERHLSGEDDAALLHLDPGADRDHLAEDRADLLPPPDHGRVGGQQAGVLGEA